MMNKIKALWKIIIFYVTILLIAVFSVTLNQVNLNFKFTQKAFNYQKTNHNYSNMIFNKTNKSKEDVYKNSLIEMNKLNNDNIGWDSHTISGHDTQLIQRDLYFGKDFKVEGSAFAEKKRVGKLGDAKLGFLIKMKINNNWSNQKHYDEDAYGSVITKKEQNFIFKQKVLLNSDSKIIFNVETPDDSGFQVSGSSIDFGGGTLNDKLKKAYENQYFLAKKFINSNNWKKNKFTQNKALKWNIAIYLKQISFEKLTYQAYDDVGWGDSSVDNFNFFGISFEVGWEVKVKDISIQEKIYNKKIFISNFALNNTIWTGAKLKTLIQLKNSKNQNPDYVVKSIQLDEKNRIIKLNANLSYGKKKFQEVILKIPIHVYSLNYLVSVSKESSKQWKHITINNEKYHSSPPITQLEISPNFLKSLKMFTARKKMIEDVQKGNGWSFMNNDNKNNIINKINSFAINFYNVDWFKKVWNSNNQINLNNILPPTFINKYLNDNDWDDSTSWDEYLFLLKKAIFSINSSAIVANSKITSWKFKYQNIKGKGKITLNNDEIAKNGNKTIWEMKVNNLEIQNQKENIINKQILKIDKDFFNLEKTDLNIKYDVTQGNKSIIHKYFFQPKPIDISEDVSFTLTNGTVLDKNFLIASGKNRGQPGWTSIRYLYNDGNASEYVLLQKVKNKYYVPELKQWIKVLDPSFENGKIEYIFNDDVQMIINPYKMNGQKIGPGIIKASTIKKYGISKVEDKFNDELRILEDWNDGKWSHSHNDKGAILDGLFGVDLNGYADKAGRLGIGTHEITIYLQNQGPTTFKNKYKLIIDKSINKLKVLPVERKLETATIRVKPSNYLLWSKNKTILDVERYQNGFILKDKRVNAEWINQKEFYIKLNTISNINFKNKIWLYDPNGLKLFWLNNVNKKIFKKWSESIGKYLKIKAPNLSGLLFKEKQIYLNNLKNLESKYQTEYNIFSNKDQVSKISNLTDWQYFYLRNKNIKIITKLSTWKKSYKNYVLKQYNKLSNYDLDKTYDQLKTKIDNCKTFKELRKLKLKTKIKPIEVSINEKDFANYFTNWTKESWDLPYEQFNGIWYSSMYMNKNDNDKVAGGITLKIYDSSDYLALGPNDAHSGYNGRSAGKRKVIATKTSDFENWKISLAGAYSNALWQKHKNKTINLTYLNDTIGNWISNHKSKKIAKIEVTFSRSDHYKIWTGSSYAQTIKGVYSYLKAKVKIFCAIPKTNFYWPWKVTTNDPKTKKINYDYGNYLQTSGHKIIETTLSASQEQEFPIHFSNGSIKFVMYDVDIKSIQADLLASDGKWYQIPIDIKTEKIDGKYYKVINSTINYAGFARVQIMDQSNNIKTVYFKLSPNSKSIVPNLMFKTKDVIKNKDIPKNWMGQKITFINPSTVLSIDPLVTDIKIQKLTLNQNGYINKTNATNQEVSISDYRQKITKGYSFGSTIGESGLKYAGDELKPFLKSSDTKLASWTLNDKKMDFKEPGLYQVILKTRLSGSPIVKQFIYVKSNNDKDFMNENNVSKENTNFDLNNNLDHSKPITNKDKLYPVFKKYKLHYWPFLIKKVNIAYSYLWYSDFFKINVSNDLLLSKEGKYKISLTSIFNNTFNHKILVLDKFKTTMSRKIRKISMIAKDSNKLEETAFWKGNKIWSDWRWVDQDYWQWSYEEFKRIGLEKGLTIEQINAKWKKWNQNKDWNGKWVTGILMDKREEWEKKKHIVKIIKPFEKWTFNLKNNTYTHNGKAGILNKTGNGKWKINGFSNLSLIQGEKGKLILVTDSSILHIIKSTLEKDEINNKDNLHFVSKLKDGFLIDKQGTKKLLINTLDNHFLAIANGKYDSLTKNTNNKWTNNKWTFDLQNKTYIHNGKTGVLNKVKNGKWNLKGFHDLSLIQSKDNKLVLGNKKEFLEIWLKNLGQKSKLIIHKKPTAILEKFKNNFILHDKDGNILIINPNSYSKLSKDLNNNWLNQKRIIGFTGSDLKLNIVKEKKATTQSATSKTKPKWQIGFGILGSLIFIAILIFIKKRLKLKKIK